MPKRTIAIILAGGHVGQYGILSANRAKAAMPFAGMYRIVDFAISNIRNAGIKQVGIVIQYLPKSLIEHVEVGLSWDLYGHGRILKIMPPFVGIGKTEWYKGTGDAVYRNLDFISRYDPENVLICSGEQIFHLDIADVVRFHRDNDADLTIVSKYMAPEEISPRFGRLVCDASRLFVREFVEKPPQHDSRQVCIGIFLFKTRVLLELLDEMIERNLGYNLSAHAVARAPAKFNVLNYEYRGYWNYLETIEDFFEANMSLTRGDSPIDLPSWEIYTNAEGRGLGYRPPTFMGENSLVADSYISPGCRIKGTLVRSVLSPGVHVEAGAVVEDSILMHDCRVGENARLQYVVSDKDAVFAPGCVAGVQLGVGPSSHNARGRLTIVGKGATIETKNNNHHKTPVAASEP